MKKITLYTIMALFVVIMAGCKKEDIVITGENVNTNTFLIKNDGTVQVATVEEFDKNYYNLTELQNFITTQINEYNQKQGVEAIVLDSLDIKDGNAVLILNYMNINHYNAFNEKEFYFTTVESAKNGEITFPDVFISASDGAYASKELALKKDKYKVLVIKEDTNVWADGTIKFYTNGVLDSKSKLQTSSEDETIIIYKP